MIHPRSHCTFHINLRGGQSVQQADYVVPVEIEYQWHNVYVIKRPGVDNFLKKMGEIYEIVVFTASLSKVSPTLLLKMIAS